MGEQTSVDELLLLDEVASLERESATIRRSDPSTAHGRLLWRKLARVQAELEAKRALLRQRQGGGAMGEAKNAGTGFVCPICFTLVPAAQVHPEWPLCPDCDGEAISVELQPLSAFLAAHSLEDLNAILREWQGAQGFRGSYKETKRRRIERIIALKHHGDRA